jgi:hypothetical protein
MTNFSGGINIAKFKKAMADKGWEGPAIVYLLCRPYYPLPNTKGEVEFIAKVTPDPKWSFQRWHNSDYIQFRENIGKRLFYQVEEIPLSVGETHVAFDTFLVHNVDGSKMAGFDLD